MELVQWMDQRLYAEYANNWDDQIFKEIIDDTLQPDYHILDLGAGAGIVKQMNFRGKVTRVCGIDPDPRVATNPYLDQGVEGIGEAVPYPDATFDIVFADNVMEHLEYPEKVFGEVARVLKKGGLFLTKTPNRNHYMPLIARLTPYWFHRFVNKLRGRNVEDTFPTFYRVNTPKDVQKYAAITGFKVVEVHLVEGRPEYLRLTPVTYLVGWLYERIVNKIEFMKKFRCVLISKLEKQ
jgi:SAM-dependent methyltransferase